jgi:hypothetical protein
VLDAFRALADPPGATLTILHRQLFEEVRADAQSPALTARVRLAGVVPHNG